MDEFEKAEQSGRALFIEILQQLQITDYRESAEKYDTLDVYCTIKEHSTGVEIKKRDKQFEHYPTYMMELYKYNALVDRVNNKELDQIYYVNFFGSDTAYIFSLRRIAQGIADGTVKVTSTYANKTTAAFSGKVEKRIILIPKQYATKLIKDFFTIFEFQNLKTDIKKLQLIQLEFFVLFSGVVQYWKGGLPSILLNTQKPPSPS